MDNKEKARILGTAVALLETVQESSYGAPGGVLYAAVCGKLSFEEFQAIMSALVMAGQITKKHQCYYPVKKKEGA